KATPDVGFLHRGDEKIAENMQYNQFVPYTDRLDYLAPLANNVAYALAVEKLMGWEIPPRGKAIRVICCELARISSHLMGLGAIALLHMPFRAQICVAAASNTICGGSIPISIMINMTSR